jgi:3-oxoacyl-(acyl-carrier-protein) synthase
MARLSERVDWIAGAGNGTALDALEVRTLVEALGATTLPPISSVLGHTGESFSSAALRLLAAIWALEQQRLPGTVGVLDPLPELATALVREPRAAAVQRVLIPSLSQGGANVVVALARP